MLSISPIVHNRQLMFYLASLQDYTYHMHKLVRLTPTQFCRSAEHHQMTRRVPSSFEPHDLARPAIFEADDECAITLQPQGTSDSLASSVPLKVRFGNGWDHQRFPLPSDESHPPPRLRPK